MVDHAVTEIIHAAKDEAAAAELSEAPDSKLVEEEEEEEESEVPTEAATEAASEADVKEAEEHDGIHSVFLNRHIHYRYNIDYRLLI